jgi:hypothetical protein
LHEQHFQPQPFEDLLPEGPGPLLDLDEEPSEDTTDNAPPSRAPRVRVWLRTKYRTARNTFGVIREYFKRPKEDFDEDAEEIATVSQPSIFPFPNTRLLHLFDWFYNTGDRKTMGNFRILQKTVLTPDGYNVDDMRFNLESVNQAMDDVTRDPETNPFQAADGWHNEPVTIRIPLGKKKGRQRRETEFSVSSLHYRRITEVVKSVYQNEQSSRTFHHVPFREYWQAPGTDTEHKLERVYSEIYTSEAMNDEYEKLQRSPPEPGCEHERVIAALMFWSDATHLTNFGTAKLWPVYLFFGNQSKYERCKRNSHTASHIAYVPSVSELRLRIISRS